MRRIRSDCRIVSAFAAFFAVTICKATNAGANDLLIESSGMQSSIALGRPMLTWWDVTIHDLAWWWASFNSR